MLSMSHIEKNIFLCNMINIEFHTTKIIFIMKITKKNEENFEKKLLTTTLMKMNPQETYEEEALSYHGYRTTNYLNKNNTEKSILAI